MLTAASTPDAASHASYNELKAWAAYTAEDALTEWAEEAGCDHPVISNRMVERARLHIRAFDRDNSGMTPEQLEEMAAALSPGGVHTSGHLVQLIRYKMFGPDSFLVAATIWHNWHGGKVGFQFLPDPAQTERAEYYEHVADLGVLEEGTNGDPRRILTGADRAFYDSLPERFTIYRGVCGISVDMAELGCAGPHSGTSPSGSHGGGLRPSVLPWS